MDLREYKLTGIVELDGFGNAVLFFKGSNNKALVEVDWELTFDRLREIIALENISLSDFIEKYRVRSIRF